jgi:hypothetical protein
MSKRWIFMTWLMITLILLWLGYLTALIDRTRSETGCNAVIEDKTEAGR